MSEASIEFRAQRVPRADFIKEHPQPVVLGFQPEQFAVLDDPEDLRTWEALLVDRVGFSAEVGRAISEAIAANGGTCCESGSTNDCDQD